MLSTLVLSAALAGDCAPVAPDAWRGELEVALRAWERLDEAAFRDTVARARASVPCLAGPVSPADAAAWHLVSAVAAWFEDPDHPATAVDHLRAALAAGLEPDARPGVIPPGSPMDASVTSARAALPGGSPLPDRSPLTLRVDGRWTADGPPLPALLQLEGPRGVLWSASLPAPWPLPAPRRRWLVPVTAATAGGAAALWGAAVGLRVALDQGGDPDTLWRPNQALLGTSAGLAGVALGFGVATWIDTLRARRAP